jgi:periplasmic protein TonB
MIAPAADRAELRRWAACAAVVLGLHVAGGAMLVAWREPVTVGEASTAIMVVLTPLANAAIDNPEDIAPGPKQQEMEAPPPEPQKTEEKVEEKVELPPSPALAALPPPEPEKPKPPEPEQAPPAPATTAPPRQRTPPQSEITSWHSRIVAQIERHKAYPPAAQSRGENGVVQLAFTLDRQGHVLSSQIVRSSGHPALDQESMATVRRAQPFPPPPIDLPGAQFAFTVPVRFNIR